MLPDDHPDVKKELNRRLAARNKTTPGVRPETIQGDATATGRAGQGRGRAGQGKAAVAKKKDKDEQDTLEADSSGKWRSTHQQLAESRLSVGIINLFDF